jgi:hypothetical protein
MVSRVKIGWITDGPAELDGFERVGGVEREVFDNKFGSFGHDPLVKEQVPSIKGTTSVHEAAEGEIGGWVGAEGEGDVREPVVNGNGHWGERWGDRNIGRERFDKLNHEKTGLLLVGVNRGGGGRWRRQGEGSGGGDRRRRNGRDWGWGKGECSREGLGASRGERDGEDFGWGRRSFAEVGLMSEQILIEDRSSAGVAVSRAGAEYVLDRATTHTTAEADGIRATEISDGVTGEIRSGARGLVALHCGFGWGEKGAGHGGDIVGGCRVADNGWNGRKRGGGGISRSWGGRKGRWCPGRRSSGEGSRKSSAFQATCKGTLDEFFLGAEEGIVANGNHADSTESGQLKGPGG